MLTKDLIRCKTYKGLVRPQFIDVDNPELLEMAEQLISVYQQKTQPVRMEIEEYTTPVINTASDMILVKGLNKLLLDRSTFSHEEGVDHCVLRKNVFNISGELLIDKGEMDYADYKEKMFANSNVDSDFLEKGIYPDLPENERLILFKNISPNNLLERYNCSLVQSLLLSAKSITLTIKEPKAAKIRQTFKYLKFFRLLSRITREDEETPKKRKKKDSASTLHVVIDGPMSLFENTQKYGLQLASFFPTICHLSDWKLETEVKYKERLTTLKLDQDSKLTGHYTHFGSYVPEEIDVFQKDFKSKVKDWKITEDTPFLPSENQELIFPDLSFKNKDKKLVHLELFHRWHATQLISRLQYGDANPNSPLIIGVDRSLYKKPEIKEELDKNQWFANNGFLFNSFPRVDKVCKCLESKERDENSA